MKLHDIFGYRAHADPAKPFLHWWHITFQLYLKGDILSHSTGVQLSAWEHEGAWRGPLIPSSGRRGDLSLRSSLALRDCIASRTNTWHGPTLHFPDGREIGDSASVYFPPSAADRCTALCAALQHSHHAHKPCCLPKPSALAPCVYSRRQYYLRG